MTTEIARNPQDALSNKTSSDLHESLHREFSSTSDELDDFVHELRQPLSTIECLTYYLELVSTDLQLRPHLQRIRDMVKQANHILERTSLPQSH
jgi:signal transduction histidine kinase